MDCTPSQMDPIDFLTLTLRLILVLSATSEVVSSLRFFSWNLVGIGITASCMLDAIRISSFVLSPQ
jgi:hypothetical protein